MDLLVTDKLFNILMIAATLSVIVMSVIQKFKTFKIISRGWHLFILDLLFSFALGIFFSYNFYNMGLKDSLWVSIFSFIGAPAVYQLLKKQNIINYTPKALDDTSNNSEVTIENTDTENK